MTMIFLLNTLLGFLIAQIWDIMSRNKYSESSPIKFNVGFFLKDTWLKIVVSLVLSLSMSLLVYLNIGDFSQLIGSDLKIYNNVAYIVIGFAPERILAIAKKKYGFLQKDEVQGYERK